MSLFSFDRPADPPVGATLKEGWPYILGLALLALPLWRWKPLAGLAALMAAGAVASFFRDPTRPLDPEADTFYSPADGTVIGTDIVEDPWFVGRPCHRISIFLSVFNVHVNRSPVAGHIVEVRELGTGFAPAMSFERSHENRRREIGLETARGRIVVVQVAGLIARRVVGWVHPGESVLAGQKLGMITFGSRTDLYVPVGEAVPFVTAGQKVVGGKTPVARWL
ncbi:MAG: phosphatidylserine decarboxylase family protein [Chloroflexi bacterium]|nr:phosphatidylserine decarboxylase family protein [Chloroflexota bacterium]